MLDNLKKKLYFSKLKLLYSKGIADGKIVPFDEDFYRCMSNTYFASIPVSMHIKYLRPKTGPGKCYDRSLYMFFCFDDALLVRGDKLNLELMYGKDNAGHGWIEIGDYVYDPTMLMRFDRELYYKMFSPTNVSKVTKDDYVSVNGDFYNDIISTTISDFQPGGNKRLELCTTIPLVQGIADMSSDENLKKELDEYLSLIKYDGEAIYRELVSECYSFVKQK